jgi:hypothetical protein
VILTSRNIAYCSVVISMPFSQFSSHSGTAQDVLSYQHHITAIYYKALFGYHLQTHHPLRQFITRKSCGLNTGVSFPIEASDSSQRSDQVWGTSNSFRQLLPLKQRDRDVKRATHFHLLPWSRTVVLHRHSPLHLLIVVLN